MQLTHTANVGLVTKMNKDVGFCTGHFQLIRGVNHVMLNCQGAKTGEDVKNEKVTNW